ncbi:MAG: SMP-30/gluconolactonase/LRE family protein [Verrucomicrobiota bacterium]
MKTKLLIASIALLGIIGSPAQQKTGDEKWVDLFDGKTLKGWKPVSGKAVYTVEDGAIVGTTAPNTYDNVLATEKEYGDFILELDFKVHSLLNSGIQIRCHKFNEGDEKPKKGKTARPGHVYGYSIEIDPSDRAWSGGFYEGGHRGWLKDLTDNPAARFAFKQNQWNHFRIEAIGDHFRTWINGVPAIDVHDSETATGFIGIQVHGLGSKPEKRQVRVRNIRIQENPSPSPVAKTYVPSTGPIVPDGAQITKLADGFKFTEGPAQGPDGRIYFSDIPNERIMVFDPISKKTTVHRENSGKANGLWWTPADALLACEGGNRQLTRTDSEGNLEVLADSFEGEKFNSPNDLVQDQVGGIFFSDPRYGNRDDMEMEVEGVYYYNRRKQVTRVIDDLKRPNGVLLSIDHKTLYVADTDLKKIFAYEVTGEGTLGKRREFANIGSDGLTLDERGNLYATWKGKVWIISPEGKDLAQIDCPEGPANCFLGGPKGNTLYITARTGFYSIDLNVKAPAPYRGK